MARDHRARYPAASVSHGLRGCANRWPISFSAWSTKSSGGGKQQGNSRGRSVPGRRGSWLTLAAALVAACAATEEPLRADLRSPATPVRSCAQWYASLDRAIDEAGVRDAGAYRIPGLSLSAGRSVCGVVSRRGEGATRRPGLGSAGCRKLDATARRYELRNLSAAAPAGLGDADPAAALARSERCAEELAQADLGDPTQAARLVERAAAPDDYLDLNRVLGLYPLAADSVLDRRRTLAEGHDRRLPPACLDCGNRALCAAAAASGRGANPRGDGQGAPGPARRSAIHGGAKRHPDAAVRAGIRDRDRGCGR